MEQSVPIDVILETFVYQCHVAKRYEQESLCNAVATILTFSFKKMGPALDGSLLKLLENVVAVLAQEVLTPEVALSQLKLAINNLYK